MNLREQVQKESVEELLIYENGDQIKLYIKYNE